MSKKQITAVIELDESRYKTKIFADGHFIYADEPEELGGTNEGMAPGALLLASLGSCTAITVRMYADRKQIPLTGLTIHLTICPEDEMDKSTTIERKIELHGDLDEEQRKRLMIIADKCPIHKILSNPIKIVSNS
ncbi:OsmC family protein [Pedobacter xixiisoli]|uniref:Putative redox protein n=1 Tax=Pedobacter xixiisoli TaxID=1476464 RepID=A0A285ZT66_9SPHI|nr:OsmC family protein [Pedobacter xixiisoli]SOD12850.1 putative redox protein [Pedobacter xixiisoli]